MAAMPRWVAKLLGLVFVVAVVFGATVLPIKLSDVFARQGRRGELIIERMMCFGGGVFLGVYALHMGPDARQLVHDALGYLWFPVADAIIAVGFFLMLFVDVLVQQKGDGGKKKEAAPVRSRRSSFDAVEHRNGQNGTVLVDGRTVTANGIVPVPVVVIADVDGAGNEDQPLTGVQNGNDHTKSGYQLQDGVLLPPSVHLVLPTGGAPPLDVDVVDEPYPVASSRRHSIVSAVAADLATSVVDGDGEQHVDVTRATRSLVLLLALSMDHIFEGLSIGLQDSVTAVWSLCLAIVAHESVIAFSLGLQLVKRYGKQTRKVIVSGAVCAAMVPVGICIGTIIKELGSGQGNTVTLVNGILQCLATGVFTYVTFFEILQRELGDHPTFVKFFFVFLGFVVMGLFALIPDHTASKSSSLDADADNSTAFLMIVTTLAS